MLLADYMINFGRCAKSQPQYYIGVLYLPSQGNRMIKYSDFYKNHESDADPQS